MLKLSKEKRYLLACSGGPDSMSLFKMLLKNNISFDVAFVNYHKRKESVLEEESVRNYCLENNINFHLLDTRNLICKGNFQSWARNVRYEFFYSLVKERGLDAILVAHQKDDVVETYIFQQKRKGNYSYYGINYETYYKDVLVIRPLLNFRKKELENYCIKNDVPYFIDSSNLKDDYSRNKIRHMIVEKLSDIEIGNIIKEINYKNKIELENKKYANDFIHDKKVFSISEFDNNTDSIKEKIIYILLSKYKKKITGREISEILNFILSNKNTGAIKITQKCYLYKNYGVFYFADENKMITHVVDEPRIIDEELFYFDLEKGVDKFFIKNDSYPLTITNPKKDEKVKIGSIEKKVNRLFIDEKIPLDLRKVWPVIKDKNGKIIYFPRKKEETENGIVIFKMKK